MSLNIMKSKNILVTGANGFIGSKIFENLRKNGLDVYGIDSKISQKKNVYQVDLLKPDFKKIKKLNFPNFEIIIHTAAIAHFDSISQHNNIIEINLKITKNLLNTNIINNNAHVIFLSSVSVYGEDGRNNVVKVGDKLKPSNFYGISKIKCEKYLLSKYKNLDILRLSPVYSKDNFKDVNKRIFLPILNTIKVKIIPSPKFSFCHLKTLLKVVNDIVYNKSHINQRIFNISDEFIYNQNDLINNSKYITLHERFFRIFYYISFIIDLNFMYKFRSYYWKFFRNNIYLCNYKLKSNYKENLLEYFKKYD